MDRDALVRRNRAVAEAYHGSSPRHLMRHGLLRALSLLPIRHCRQARRERILLINPGHMGDVLLSTAAIHALRVDAPQVELHALVRPASSTVLEHNDDLDAVITVDFPEPGISWSSFRKAWHTARQIRKLGYAGATILQPGDWWGAMVAFMAGIPERRGHEKPFVSPFLTHQWPLQSYHVVLQSACLLEGYTEPPEPEDLSPVFNYADEDRSITDRLLSQLGVPLDRPIFCIHPGSSSPVKRWVGARWAFVADTLTDQLDATAVVTGSSDEIPLAQDIANRMDHQSYIVSGQTSINQLGALFARARVVLGPDNGALHLAVAVNTPTVALFGPTDPVKRAPWGSSDRHIVLTSDIGCQPCNVLDWGGDNPDYHPCVREISIGRVLEAARLVVNHPTSQDE